MTISINVSTWDELEALARAVLHSGAGPETVKAVSAVVEKPAKAQSQSTKPEPAATEQKPAAAQSQQAKPAPAPEKKTPSMDDIKRRALSLMDAGRQPELEMLLKRYGVQSLPELEADQTKLAAFAADLEAM
ncbi:MAG: hypothetical protein IJJ21_06565 [Firmicutes bacterium]|nr:hypothetical protein [Bacillota bacterium]